MKRVLVTGGAGFIGSAFIRKLLELTDANVVNFDKLSYAGSLENIGDLITQPRHIFQQMDITHRLALDHCLEQFQPDTIVNLAAESHVDRSIAAPADFMKTNVQGTYHLLEASLCYWKKLAPQEQKAFRFLHISTDEVFGDLGPDLAPAIETSPYKPSSPYAASKACADHLVRAWYRTYDLPILISHCCNNFGPRQHPEKLIPKAITQALAGKPIPVYGMGTQIREWLYVEDHAEALLHILTRGKIGESYNIGSGLRIANIELITALCRLLDAQVPPSTRGLSFNSYLSLVVHVTDRPGHDQRYALDSQKIVDELGWTASTPFDRALEKTVTWYLDNPGWVKDALGQQDLDI